MQAVLGMSKMTPTKKIVKARLIATSLTGNTNYPLSAPIVVLILAAALDLETAYNNSRGRDKSMMTIFRSKLKALNAQMVLVLAYIQQTSGGDAIIIESAGVAVKKAKTPTQPLGKVVGLSGVQGTFEGQTDLNWTPLVGTKSYEVYMSVDGLVWVDAKCPCTKSEVTVNGLVTETYGWFKVAGVNGLGQGPWSDPIRAEAK